MSSSYKIKGIQEFTINREMPLLYEIEVKIVAGRDFRDEDPF
jgi:hypothetical protein